MSSKAVSPGRVALFLLLGTLASAWVPVSMAWDCNGVNVYNGQYCAGPTTNCGQDGCVNVSFSCGPGVCNPDPCPYRQWTSYGKYGSCKTAPELSYSCTHCDAYWCGTGNQYQNKDMAGNCINQRCAFSNSYSNVCVP
jgi:hypothetical protein